jgi:hypothetical protein
MLREQEAEMQFETRIFQSGNNTGIEVPENVVAALGAGKRPAMHVTLAGFSYRSTVAVMGGKYLIPLSAARREESGVKGGDLVTVKITLDAAPREVVLPDDFAAALENDVNAKSFYEALSYSNKHKYVLSVTEAKTPETRSRRISKALADLAAAKK